MEGNTEGVVWTPGAPDMSYEQAFHTCCRNGLTTPTLAFQYQVASPGLDREGLTALARQMVGYVTPPSARPDPSDAEIARFPVSLRYLRVPGVGAAVSQTVYVGREDRAASSGRFGNYFSHVLAALDCDRFDAGRHPIETWGSPVWRTNATAADGLTLTQLPAGHLSLVDAERGLSEGGRSRWLPFLYDCLDDALADRTRIVVLDDAAHGWAWIAAVALALPAELRDQVTFDTYAGDPERSGARICVCDPAVDRRALSHRELTGEVQLVDLASAPPPPQGLLARAIADGRRYAPRSAADEDLSLAELALVLATSGEQVTALEERDLPEAMSVITSWLIGDESRRDDLDRAAQLVSHGLDAQLDFNAIDRQTLQDLWTFISERPIATPEGVVSIALRLALRLPEWTHDVPLPQVERTSVTPDVVGDAISLMTATDLDTATELRHLELLHRLRLVGANGGLDRRIGRAAARHLATPGIADWLERLATRSESSTVAEHVIRTACGVDDLQQATLDFLTRPGVDRIHDRLCGSGDAFVITRARAAALAGAHPEQRRSTLEWALGYASDAEEAERLVDVVYGDRLNPSTMREVLSVLSAANRRPSRARVDAGWTMLEGEDPFSNDPSVRALASDLHTLDTSGSPRSVYLAIWLDQERSRTPIDEWIATVGKWSPKLNDHHLRGLLRRAVRGAFAAQATRPQHRALAEAGIAALKQTFFDCYWEELAWALRDSTRADLAADALVIWAAQSVPRDLGEEAIDSRLVKALKPWNDQAREQVSVRLRRNDGVKWAQYWQEWCDYFPPAGTVGRTIGKLFARRPRD
jgi:hypothetical protein